MTLCASSAGTAAIVAPVDAGLAAAAGRGAAVATIDGAADALCAPAVAFELCADVAAFAIATAIANATSRRRMADGKNLQRGRIAIVRTGQESQRKTLPPPER